MPSLLEFLFSKTCHSINKDLQSAQMKNVYSIKFFESSNIIKYHLTLIYREIQTSMIKIYNTIA